MIKKFLQTPFHSLIPCMCRLKLLFYYTMPYDLQALWAKGGFRLKWWLCFSLDLWYIDVIIFYYTIAPILYHYFLKVPYLLLTIIFSLCVLNQIFRTPITGRVWASPLGLANWALARLPIYAFGVYIALYYKKIEGKMLYASAGCFLMALVVISLIRKETSIPFLHIINKPCIAIGSYFMILLCAILLSKSTYIIDSFFSILGKLSLEIYLIHEFIISIFQVKWHDNNNGLFLLLMTFVCSYIIAFACKKLCSHIPLIP